MNLKWLNITSMKYFSLFSIALLVSSAHSALKPMQTVSIPKGEAHLIVQGKKSEPRLTVEVKCDAGGEVKALEKDLSACEPGGLRFDTATNEIVLTYKSKDLDSKACTKRETKKYRVECK